MNTELVPSELHAGASWGGPSRTRTPESTRGGWWDPSLGRLGIGESRCAPGGAAASFGAVPDSVRSAREFGAENLAAWGLTRLAEDVRLIISELVGNACRHAVTDEPPERTRVTLQLRPFPRDGAVVCMVADPEPRGPVRVEAHHFAESGRGLGLVAAFSREWGWNPVDGHGKIVWAICDSDPF
ncbi:ATP-binding protein [Nocardiopsis prasina]|uniref:ATP-binding protein n=1 Tax=Nocardiopsis prasina TaxID=2015 RepID=UPI00047657F5|nr:ATP-binding protein [Nocardiopsis prasina]